MTGIDAVNKVTNNHTLLQKPPLPPENFFYIIKPHQISGRQSIKMIDLTLCTSLVPLLTGVWYHFRPGPKELPIVGNLLDIPRERSCRLTYADWACTLGDVLYIILKQKRSSLRNDRRIMRVAHCWWDFVLPTSCQHSTWLTCHTLIDADRWR